MQKHASLPYSIFLCDVRLDSSFPVAGGRYRQGDNGITFLHVHRCLEIGYCHSGSGIFVVGRKVMPYNTGDFCVIGDGEPHLAQSAAGTVSDWSFYYLFPSALVKAAEGGASLSQAPFNNDFPNVISGSLHPNLAVLAFQFCEEMEKREPGYHDAVRGLAWAFMAKLDRMEPRRRSEAATQRTSSGLERVAPALHAMGHRFAAPLRVGELAALCHLSPSQFRRVFELAVGIAPACHIHKIRVAMAKSMLRSTSRSMLEIAGVVGYPTLSSFNRQFRRWAGMPPGDWRRTAGYAL